MQLAAVVRHTPRAVRHTSSTEHCPLRRMIGHGARAAWSWPRRQTSPRNECRSVYLWTMNNRKADTTIVNTSGTAYTTSVTAYTNPTTSLCGVTGRSALCAPR
jgi:hypothetical protein